MMWQNYHRCEKGVLGTREKLEPNLESVIVAAAAAVAAAGIDSGIANRAAAESI
jgi:hypothetical protein